MAKLPACTLPGTRPGRAPRKGPTQASSQASSRQPSPPVKPPAKPPAKPRKSPPAGPRDRTDRFVERRRTGAPTDSRLGPHAAQYQMESHVTACIAAGAVLSEPTDRSWQQRAGRTSRPAARRGVSVDGTVRPCRRHGPDDGLSRGQPVPATR